MPLGPCPECEQMIASSANSCPNCGNRAFWVSFKKHARLTCKKCKGTGETREPISVYGGAYGYSAPIGYKNVRCNECEGNREAVYNIYRDPRDGVKKYCWIAPNGNEGHEYIDEKYYDRFTTDYYEDDEDDEEE